MKVKERPDKFFIGPSKKGRKDKGIWQRHTKRKGSFTKIKMMVAIKKTQDYTTILHMDKIVLSLVDRNFDDNFKKAFNKKFTNQKSNSR